MQEQSLGKKMKVIYIRGSGDPHQLADLMRRGRMIEMRDALIPGCMLRNGCRSIVTRNTEGFTRIAKVEVIEY